MRESSTGRVGRWELSGGGRGRNKNIEMGKHKLYSKSGKCLLIPPQGDVKFK